MKHIIRLTEEDIHRIVKESVEKILNEYGEDPEGSGQEHFGEIYGKCVVDGEGKKGKRIADIARKKCGGISPGFTRGMTKVMDDPNSSNKLSKREHNNKKKGN